MFTLLVLLLLLLVVVSKEKDWGMGIVIQGQLSGVKDMKGKIKARLQVLYPGKQLKYSTTALAPMLLWSFLFLRAT